MSRISHSALVPFSATQMYQLVNDVNAYPDFLPGCISSRVINFDNNEMIAVVNIAKAGISKTFTTRNTLLDNQQINMRLVNGPFRKLIGDWHFTSLNAESCRVALYLDFEFTSTLNKIPFCKIFKGIENSLMQAFVQRAQQVYNV